MYMYFAYFPQNQAGAFHFIVQKHLPCEIKNYYGSYSGTKYDEINKFFSCINVNEDISIMFMYKKMRERERDKERQRGREKEGDKERLTHICNTLWSCVQIFHAQQCPLKQ